MANDFVDIASQVPASSNSRPMQESATHSQESIRSKSTELKPADGCTKTPHTHILNDDAKEMVFGKRNLKATCSTSGLKHLQRNLHSYVCHEGHIYHIAEFLAWQDGRLYIPSTGRQNRFLCCSR